MGTTTPQRRDPEQRENDRKWIMANVTDAWERPASWMRTSDIDALVKAGRLERQVRREWDRQTGYGAKMFGGAGVCIRQRAYIRKAQGGSK